MNEYRILAVLFCCFLYGDAITKVLKVFDESTPSAIYNNSFFIKERFKDKIWKPAMNDTWVNRLKHKFNPAWMDYCAPYHCNDYHKIACGLNRRSMRFKWFQSTCHLILNNQCATYRGNLKYDLVETKFCTMYVLNLRAGCPGQCKDVMEPICGVSLNDNHVVVFKNRCALDAANCRSSTFMEYEEVNMEICAYYLK